MPLPADPKTIFLGGLFALALLATAYVASEIVLPMVFAFILKLLLQPIFRFLERLRIPERLRRWCSSLPCSERSLAWHGSFGTRSQLGGQTSGRHP